jgi:hypothetical protein
MIKKIVAASLLAALSPVAWSQTAVIRSGSLKVYDTPLTTGRIITTLSDGDTVKVIEQRGTWAKLQLAGKRSGWMQLSEATSAALFKKNRKAQSPTPAPQVRKLTEQSAPSSTASSELLEEELSSASSMRNQPAGEPEVQAGAGLADIETPLNLGISFSLGALGQSFAYSGRFMYRTMPKIFIEGAFQHVPGDVAASMLIHSNLLYDFALAPRWDGWITGGVGVISTSPTKTVGAKSVSNMEVNYGVGARRYLKHRTYLRGDLRQFSVITDNGTKNYIEFAVGIIIGIQ